MLLSVGNLRLQAFRSEVGCGSFANRAIVLELFLVSSVGSQASQQQQQRTDPMCNLSDIYKFRIKIFIRLPLGPGLLYLAIFAIQVFIARSEPQGGLVRVRFPTIFGCAHTDKPYTYAHARVHTHTHRHTRVHIQTRTDTHVDDNDHDDHEYADVRMIMMLMMMMMLMMCVIIFMYVSANMS